MSLELNLYRRLMNQARRIAELEASSSGIIDRPSGGGSDYSDFAFGFSVSGAVVTVNAGKVRHGIRDPILVAATPITVTTDQTWIYCEYVFGSGVAVVTSSLTEPSTNQTTLRYPLHLWGVLAGTVSIEKILHLGDIIIPGSFA